MCQQSDRARGIATEGLTEGIWQEVDRFIA